MSRGEENVGRRVIRVFYLIRHARKKTTKIKSSVLRFVKEKNKTNSSRIKMKVMKQHEI